MYTEMHVQALKDLYVCIYLCITLLFSSTTKNLKGASKMFNVVYNVMVVCIVYNVVVVYIMLWLRT